MMIVKATANGWQLIGSNGVIGVLNATTWQAVSFCKKLKNDEVFEKILKFLNDEK